MSTFTDKYSLNKPALDGPNDLKSEVKTSYIIQQEAAAEAAKKAKRMGLIIRIIVLVG